MKNAVLSSVEQLGINTCLKYVKGFSLAHKPLIRLLTAEGEPAAYKLFQ